MSSAHESARSSRASTPCPVKTECKCCERVKEMLACPCLFKTFAVISILMTMVFCGCFVTNEGATFTIFGDLVKLLDPESFKIGAGIVAAISWIIVVSSYLYQKYGCKKCKQN